jgi:hypothetical protein
MIEPDVEAAEVPGDKVVEEEDVLGVLDVEHDGGLAGRKVAVQADAVPGKLEIVETVSSLIAA